jgi:hypothetical protein
MQSGTKQHAYKGRPSNQKVEGKAFRLVFEEQYLQFSLEKLASAVSYSDGHVKLHFAFPQRNPKRRTNIAFEH